MRVLLGLSYDRGELDQHTTADLRRKIASLVQDPDSNFTINVGRIFWSDLTGDVDLQYVLPQGKSVTTYLGVGMGVHVRKGSGKAIDGTFVADAMGGVDAGLNANQQPRSRA